MNTNGFALIARVAAPARGSDLTRRWVRKMQFGASHFFFVHSILLVGLLASCGGSTPITSAPPSPPSPAPPSPPSPGISYGHFRALKPSTAASAARPRPNENTPTAAMSYPRIDATATLLNNGQVLVAGGSSEVVGSANSAATNTAELFNPETETFSLLTSTMSWNRANHCAVTLSSGAIILIGGWGSFDEATPPSTVDEFNPNTNAFVSHQISGSLPVTGFETPPECFQLPGDRIFFNSDRSGPMVLDSSTWTTHEIQITGVPPGYKRIRSSATQTPDGMVWIVGGDNSSLDNTATSDVARFDPADESAKIVSHLIQPRSYPGVLPFSDNSIEVYGGVFFDETGTTAIGTTSVERITPAGVAIKIGDLPLPKFTFTPIMLQNGSSLQVGGSDLNGITIDTQFVFNETTHVSGVTGSMVEKRRGYAITRLNTGRVFIVGGEAGWANVPGSKTAEIFEPDSNLYLLIPKSTLVPGQFAQLSIETSLSGTPIWTAKYGTVTATGGYTAPSTNPTGQGDKAAIIQDEITARLSSGEKAVAQICIVFPSTSRQ